MQIQRSHDSTSAHRCAIGKDQFAGQLCPRADQLEMIRILHAASVQSGNGQNLDLELLLNQLGGIFKPKDDTPEDDGTFQTALSAQIPR